MVSPSYILVQPPSGFIGNELTSIHRAWSHVVHAHASRLQLLANATGKVFHWRLGACIWCIETSEGAQQSGHNGNDLAIVGYMGGCGLQDEKCSLGINSVAQPSLAILLIIRQWAHRQLTQTSSRIPPRKSRWLASSRPCPRCWQRCQSCQSLSRPTGTACPHFQHW